MHGCLRSGESCSASSTLLGCPHSIVKGNPLALGRHAEGPVRPLRALHDGRQLPRVAGLLDGRQVVGRNVQQRAALHKRWPRGARWPCHALCPDRA